MEVISEFYNMNLKAETIKGLKQNAMQGFHNGGRAPYGYRLQRNENSAGVMKTTYILGPDLEVETVKRIFNLRAYEHYSCKKIAELLNSDNIPSYYRNKWQQSSIRKILSNETYIGNLVWNMCDYGKGSKKKDESEWIRFENAHPAIVSREIFDLANAKCK